jgi:diacylglycerol kinase family enzyme
MRYFFIINPHARNGRGGKKTAQLLFLLNQAGIGFEHAFTTSLDHAALLSRQANQDGYDVIVAVGGDGTINKVLNGFFDASGKRVSPARMGVIHTGTSPDLCKSHGIPRALPDAVRAILSGTSSPVSVGRIECAAVHGGSSGQPHYFGCCANIGLGASLARAANSGIRKYAGDVAGTFLSLLGVLSQYRPVNLTIEIDGRQRTLSRVYDIAIGRTRHIASGIQVRHDLSPVDPRLYIVVVRALSVSNIISVLRLLYGGHPIPAGREYISLEYGSRVVISGDRPVEVEFDGDPGGYCPCSITTAVDRLDLITGGSHAG